MTRARCGPPSVWLGTAATGTWWSSGRSRWAPVTRQASVKSATRSRPALCVTWSRGDPADRLARDGGTLSLRAPLVSETTSDWYRLQARLDPIFLVGDG